MSKPKKRERETLARIEALEQRVKVLEDHYLWRGVMTPSGFIPPGNTSCSNTKPHRVEATWCEGMRHVDPNQKENR